jgi:uncharacterized repeat protein (TIGR03803 family)
MKTAEWSLIRILSAQQKKKRRLPAVVLACALAGIVIDVACGGASGSGGGGGNPGETFTYSVLHTFTGQPDGGHPFAGLVLDRAGNLYGTTSSGGTSDGGTVFKLETTGKETVLYNFTGGADGGYPSQGELILDAAGNLYGTAGIGGAGGFGVVFKLDPTGTETVLHTFAGPYGGSSTGRLVQDAAGNLYGTTSGGGASKQGTVFKVDPSGKETVLYSFTGGTDGTAPITDLALDTEGDLYGTTDSGGSSP